MKAHELKITSPEWYQQLGAVRQICEKLGCHGPLFFLAHEVDALIDAYVREVKEAARRYLACGYTKEAVGGDYARTLDVLQAHFEMLAKVLIARGAALGLDKVENHGY